MYLPPEFAIGEGNRFKISASQVAERTSGFGCPAGIALNARFKAGALKPIIKPAYREWDPVPGLNFSIRDVIVAHLQGNDPSLALADSGLTHTQRRFLAHVIDTAEYLKPALEAAAGVEYRLADDLSINTTVGGMTGEITAFAHHCRSIDGRAHEAVRVRLKPLRDLTEADRDWTAVTAMVLGYLPGVTAETRLRISEFSVADGGLNCIFDGTRADADALSTERGRPVRDALSAMEFRPGQACMSCAFIGVCPALDRRRGVLGIPGRAIARRALTSTDLDAYRRCPTAFHAKRRDHLPDGSAPGALQDVGPSARDRGSAVHKLLQGLHDRTPQVCCATADFPVPDSDETTALLARVDVTLDAYRLAHPYLIQHLARCSLGLESLGDWQVEPRFVVFDEDADVVVSTAPDLTCVVDGTSDLIWREVKTTATLPPDIEAALDRYPGFALHVGVLLAEARARGVPAHAELEVLTPNDSTTFAVSMTDGAVVAYANKLVADIARQWATDVTYERRPSAACATCEANRWCDPPDDIVAATSDRDVEFDDYPAPF